MPFPYASDVKAIFEGGDFETVAYTPVGGAVRTVYGSFDDHYNDPLGIEGNSPRFMCALADISSDVTHGATILRESTTYKVVGINEDGLGSVWLQLEEQ